MCGFKKGAAITAALTMAASMFITASAETTAQANPTVTLVSRSDTVKGSEYIKYDIMYSQDAAASGISFDLKMPAGMELVNVKLNENTIAKKLGHELVGLSDDMKFVSYDKDGKVAGDVKDMKLGSILLKTNGIEGALEVKNVSEVASGERNEDIVPYYIGGYDDFMGYTDMDYTFTPDKASAKAGDIITYDVSFDVADDVSLFQTSLIFSEDLAYDSYVGEDHFDIPNDFDYLMGFVEDIDQEIFNMGQNDYTFVGMNKPYYASTEIISNMTVDQINSCKKGKHDLCQLRFKAVNDIADTHDLIDTYNIIAIYDVDADVVETPDLTQIETASQKINATLPKINELNAAKAAAPSMPGDVNGSDNVDVSDISVIATHIKGIKPIDDSMMKNADVDHDGNISVSDISKVAAHIKGIKALV